jgi:hypothetical protein
VSIAREFLRAKAMEVRSSIRCEALGVFSQPEVMARIGSAGITSGLPVRPEPIDAG